MHSDFKTKPTWDLLKIKTPLLQWSFTSSRLQGLWRLPLSAKISLQMHVILRVFLIVWTVAQLITDKEEKWNCSAALPSRENANLEIISFGCFCQPCDFLPVLTPPVPKYLCAFSATFTCSCREWKGVDPLGAQFRCHWTEFHGGGAPLVLFFSFFVTRWVSGFKQHPQHSLCL